MSDEEKVIVESTPEVNKQEEEVSQNKSKSKEKSKKPDSGKTKATPKKKETENKEKKSETNEEQVEQEKDNDKEKKKKETHSKDESVNKNETNSQGTQRQRAQSKVSPHEIEEKEDGPEILRLWHYQSSNRSGRILWLIKELGINENFKLSVLSSPKDKREYYAEMNPTMEVPTLRHGNPGLVLFEPGSYPFTI